MRVVEVQEDEGQELRRERRLNGQKQRGPRDGGREHADPVPVHGVAALEFGPLEAPVDCAEEGDDLGVLD